MSPLITRNSTGLLIQEDTWATGWTSSGGFSVVADPAIVVWPMPSAMLTPTAASADSQGVREGQIYTEGSTWYLYYDAGNGTTGWRTFTAISYDRGVTWTKQGADNSAITNGTGGNWAATAMGFREQRGSQYIFQRAAAQNTFGSPNTGLPAVPYLWDIWTASSPLGPWTWNQNVPLMASGQWADVDLLPSCTYLSGGTYYQFVEGAMTGDAFKIGYATASSPTGTWTVNATPMLSSSNFDGPRVAENPRVFYHSGLSTYVMLVNLINPSGVYTDQNAMVFSSTLTGFGSGTIWVTQRIFDPDTCNAKAVGVAYHLTGPDGTLIQENGYIPLSFDSFPTSTQASGGHLGRSIYGAIGQPSANRLHYSNATTAVNTYTYTLSHTDIVAEFEVDWTSTGNSNAFIGFRPRYNGSSNGYELRVRNQPGSNWLALYAVNGTLLQTGSVTNAGTEIGPMMRIRFSCIGSTLKAWLGGELQINVTDTNYTTGTNIAVSACDITGNVRLLSATTSPTITIRGLTPSSTVNLRTHGGMQIAAVTADGSGVATYAAVHYPFSRVEFVPGSDAQTSDGLLWGGDDVTVNIPPRSIPLLRTAM